MISNLLHIDNLLHNPWLLLVFAFQIWMLIDAIRRKEWIWAILILIFFGLTALFYYLFVYRTAAAPSATRGFELPGAHDRRRISELEAQIHHLDKAHHHSQLGDIYFQQGKLDKAEACYRAAMQRDPQDVDTRAHLGQCLLHEKRATEARPLLEGVIAENPRHEYGYTMMALAETLSALGDSDAALKMWQQVTTEHSYARAKVQLAELYFAKGHADLAKAEVKDIVSDDLHAPAFQRKRDRVWVNRAKSLMGKL